MDGLRRSGVPVVAPDDAVVAHATRARATPRPAGSSRRPGVHRAVDHVGERVTRSGDPARPARGTGVRQTWTCPALLRGVGAGILLIGSTEMLAGCAAPAAAPAPVTGYGDLVPDPNGMLALPKDFRCTIVTQAGVTTLDSGEPTPRNHDGTGAFARPGGGVVLVINHEIGDPYGTELPVPHHDGLTYDPGAAGGCTVITTDARGNRLGEIVGVAGTATNCAGGVTPWNTWLTCEEIDALAGTDGFWRDHGYVFEVDPFDPAANRDPQPILALGRVGRPHDRSVERVALASQLKLRRQGVRVAQELVAGAQVRRDAREVLELERLALAGEVVELAELDRFEDPRLGHPGEEVHGGKVKRTRLSA